jgi:hypothetical protein
MFVQDYSGFTRAAEIQAQGMQNLGATIGQGIKDFGEARQERKKIDAEIKATSAGIESAIKMGKDLGIDIGGYLSPIQAKINDPNTSPAEALALGRTAAQGISNAFTLGIGAQERSIASQRARDENAFKLANLEVAQQRANIYGQKAQAEASKLTKGTLSFFDPDTNQSEEMDVNYDPQGRPRVIGTGELIVDPVKVKYGEGGVDKPPETSQVSGISDSIAQTAKMNIGRLSTAKTPGTQGGNLGCADAICRTYEQATGEELVKGGTLSTSEMVGKLANDPRFQSVSVNQAQPGDIIVTPRGKKAGHTGIVLEGGAIASNSSKGFKGGSPGTFVQNYTINSWMNSVAPRNPGKTQVFRRIEEAASPQMAGTPEQQAEVARQIEQGAGMQMVQAGGGMPTEPSLAQQQPQLPARRQVVATRPVGGGGQQQKTVKVVSGEEAQKYDLPPSGTYEISLNPDGGFAGTEKTIIPPISEEQFKKETKIEQEQALRSAGDAAEGIRIVNKLTQSSGFAGVFGVGIRLKYLPSTEARTAENYRKKLVALATTDTMRKFQGLGQMSDKEFGVAQDSATMLSDPGISEEAAASELNRLRSYFATSIRRAEGLGRIPKGTAQKLIEQSMSAAGAQGGQSNQAEDDASFIQGFRSGE